MPSASLWLLGLAVSLDSFGAGLTYGIKEIKIPFRSIFIISICSAATLFFSMAVGHGIEQFLSPDTGQLLGGFILIAIGICFLWQVMFKKEEKAETETKSVLNLEIKSIGLVIKILKKPVIADFDRSGSITGIEAVLLGIALSLDAFGAGVGAALIDLPPVLTAGVSAAMSCLFLWSGMACGMLVSKYRWMQKLSLLPGMLLIIIGLMKL
ncbi:sporulation membrane protein YtaF [Fictibacillus aquaticus]|uniref:Sporulation membrane protein YtaF n=1 Tax=Fictibacillus aquaticus TaxID=2021314 RepID=A0A235FAE8_9BACL|nr:sporulation membrane protein YtaF [Fictibacillus aquaticus]OYD58169.1 sporulation membrane protein YtaF [Fictibacillus aquaticus]